METWKMILRSAVERSFHGELAGEPIGAFPVQMLILPLGSFNGGSAAGTLVGGHGNQTLNLEALINVQRNSSIVL